MATNNSFNRIKTRRPSHLLRDLWEHHLVSKTSKISPKEEEEEAIQKALVQFKIKLKVVRLVEVVKALQIRAFKLKEHWTQKRNLKDFKAKSRVVKALKDSCSQRHQIQIQVSCKTLKVNHLSKAKLKVEDLCKTRLFKAVSANLDSESLVKIKTLKAQTTIRSSNRKTLRRNNYKNKTRHKCPNRILRVWDSADKARVHLSTTQTLLTQFKLIYHKALSRPRTMGADS